MSRKNCYENDTVFVMPRYTVFETNSLTLKTNSYETAGQNRTKSSNISVLVTVVRLMTIMKSKCERSLISVRANIRNSSVLWIFASSVFEIK